MPVSAFSSGNAAVRSASRGEQIARWNLTRATISRDERRMSVNEISEVDGNGLYERSDWPLSDKPFVDLAIASHQDEWIEGDQHITTVGNLDSLDKKDVDDIDENAQEELQQVGGADDKEGQGDEDTNDGAETRPLDKSQPTHATKQQHDTSSASLLESSPRISCESAHSTSASHGTLEDGRVSPVGQHPGRPSSDSDTRSTTSSVSILEPADERIEQGEHSPPTSLLHAANAPSRTLTLADGHNEEHLDATPPLPSEAFQDGRDVARSRSSTQSPSSLRPNDSTTHHGRHARHSSAAKAFQGFHSRQSSYNTTFVPSNRDRVRYSWQSIHEDDSGKPRIHVIKLVSNTASASSAFPQGEAFGFSISPGGRRIAAYNSARLFILQTAALPVGISQDFSLKRRPLAVELNDSGSLVAILADEHTVNVYDLSNSKLKRIKTVKLDFSTNCIAIAPCGGLLAAAYDNGIEVFSLAPSALPTDRRAVRSPKMDRLTFSEDGSTLLGTTTRIHASSTVIVNVPIFPAAPSGVPTPEELKVAWCSELLHPENIRNSSHATFMREDRAVRNEHVFAWNDLGDTFGILSAINLEYGPIDFPLLVSPPLSTCGGLGAAIHSCPAVDEFGDSVAMIVNDRTIRLYMVPQVGDGFGASVEAHSIDHELDDGYGCPFGDVRWVHSPPTLPTPIRSHTQPRGRLLVTSPGGVYSQEQIEDSFDEVEGGRIILFDFDPQFTGQPGQTFILNLGKSPPQPLQEEEYDVADAVALARRRTVKQSSADNMRPLSLGRAATTLVSSTRVTSRPNSAAIYSRRTASILSVGSSYTESSRSLPDLMEGMEDGEALEQPFSNQAPRSQASLQRAASNAQRHRYQSIEERNRESMAEDSAGNLLPLPEYTEEPNAPLPGRFRALAGLDAQRHSAAISEGHRQSQPSLHNIPMSAPPSTAETFSAEQVFATANASAASLYALRGIPMPRSLLRAYSNATTDFRRESHPAARHGDINTVPATSHSYDQQYHNPFNPGGTIVADGEGPPPLTTISNTMISRAYDNRFSTPLSSATDYQTSLPRRSSSTRRQGDNIYGAARNYNMQAFRQATATASLFPQTQSSDHLPLPASHRMQSTGTVAHPITNWRPPAPSIVITPQSPGPTSRVHSRKSSLASKSAFASTAKAKKLGFFKRRGRRRGSLMADNTDAGMLDDSQSMMTWTTNSGRKCIVM